MDSDGLLEFNHYDLLLSHAEPHLMKPFFLNEIRSLGIDLSSFPLAGCGRMDPAAEPISSTRSGSLSFRPDHTVGELASEGGSSCLSLSPPPLIGNLMTATPAHVNDGRDPTQTRQYKAQQHYSLENLQPTHIPLSANMDSQSMAPTVGFNLQPYNTDSPYFDITMPFSSAPVFAGYHQLSPTMSRTTSRESGTDQFGSHTSSVGGDTLHFDPFAGHHTHGLNTIQDPQLPGTIGMNEVDFNALPYATLIFYALLDAPEHRMVLKDIYEWFERNTDKARDPNNRGWQNSIRHNLSMNGAFRKEDQFPPPDDGKKGYVWVLDANAIRNGRVESTTRYRKPATGRPGGRGSGNATVTMARQRSGGKAARASRGRALRRKPADKHESGVRAADDDGHQPPLKLERTWGAMPGHEGTQQFGYGPFDTPSTDSFEGHVPSQNYQILTPNSVSPPSTHHPHPYSFDAAIRTVGEADRQGHFVHDYANGNGGSMMVPYGMAYDAMDTGIGF